ncbi:MAG TPA: metallophosphoesterase family protein [Terriglobales bacterium]|nr:metallophosphoesterase family protein [Terriglobales bacterium]
MISDTHGLLRDEAVEALRGADAILHAGDVGSVEVLDALKKIAPVHAIRGNVDVKPWAKKLPLTLTVELGGVKFFLIHNRGELKRVPEGAGAVIFGHSHKPLIESTDGVIYFNPGSAGPRRFRLPICVGRMRIEEGRLMPEIIILDEK